MKQSLYAGMLAFCCLWFSVSCFSQKVKVVNVDHPGTLESLLGDDRYEVDSIVITGTLNDEDFRALNNCCQKGVLSAVDLTDAQLVDNTLPERAFFQAKIGTGKGLQRIILPEGLEKIGECAFAWSGLKITVIPSTVRELGAGAFEYTYLSGVLVIPEGVEVIPRHCFSGCSRLEEVRLPGTVRIMEQVAFAGAYRMTKINFPEGLTKIGQYCFSGTGLYDIQLPNTVIEVGKMAFSDNDSLMTVRLSAGLDSLPEMLFWRNPVLTSITLPPYLRVIENNVFESCEKLQSLYMPCSTPPEVGNPDAPTENPFHAVIDRCTLYVPVGAKEAYKSANYWKEFKKIEESSLLPSGTETNMASGYRIFTREHTVIVNSESRQPEFYKVYSLAGAVLKEGRLLTGCTEIILPAGGIYIIKIGTESRKIVL